MGSTTIYHCDRCGREPKIKIWGRRIFLHKLRRYIPDSYKEYQLCDECSEELDVFLGKGNGRK